MLKVCEECGLQVSDKAIACPHCGFPIKPEILSKKTKYKANRRKRLPNGFGQISEIKNRNLRKPFRAMICVGKTETGHPISKPLKPISYFSTYNEAYAALVEYNKNPYDLNKEMTVQELYDQWSVDYLASLKSASSKCATKRAWKYCRAVYDMRVIDIRIRHIKGCMEKGTISDDLPETPDPRTQNNIKTIFNLMFDYALEYELVDRNYSRSFTLSEELVKEIQSTKEGHIPFTSDEMTTLWNNVENIIGVDMILIQCYSGWRPQELYKLKVSDVNVEDMSFVGGMKTEAGTNRKVPIHSKTQELVRKRYNQAIAMKSDFLFTDNGKPFRYDMYHALFKQIKTDLNLDEHHRPHDGRTHFVTTAKKYHVDEYAIKYIVGHKINDLTEKTYTKRKFEWLRSEIEKIKE